MYLTFSLLAHTHTNQHREMMRKEKGEVRVGEEDEKKKEKKD